MPVTRRRLLHSLAALSVPLPAKAQQAAPPGDGFRVLEARKASFRLLPEPAAETANFGYDGQSPGPVLRVKPGDAVKLRLVNKLDQPTALHFQGLRLPNALDGVPGLTQSAVPPGGSFEYVFTASEPGTYLYRASLLSNHAQQMARGMYGVLVVEDQAPPAADLDFIATLEDWQIDGKGAIAGSFNRLPDGGHLAPVTQLVTLNGKALPNVQRLKAGARVRLRLVNATLRRLTALAFDGAKPVIVAIDGQNCAPFEPVRRTIPFSPGSRFDVMLDLPREAGKEARIILRGDNEADRDLIVLCAEGEAREELPEISSLQLNPLLPAVIRLQDAKRLQINIEPVTRGDANHEWKLNGVSASGVPAKPLFSVKAGTPVQLGFNNMSKTAHVMHVHGHNIRLLHDLDDGWEPYWRDNLLIEAGRAHQIAFLAGTPGKWLIESALLEHGNTGLAAWFEVM